MKVGDVVAGRYEIEDVLGVGGMSTVVAARDAILDRRVALKILHEQYSRDPEYVERFRREARAIAALSHPNIVTVIDRGEFEGRQYIVFELVEGENLKELVRREGPLPVAVALTLAKQAARGIACAHEHGVVHRDVKPQNVLVADGVAKVTDFGIARARDREGLTTTGTVLGTSDYIAPEQASGARADERADQYSLGALLYELLTGEVPYPSDSAVAAAMRHLRDPVPSVRSRRREVSARVDAIVHRAMAKRPEDRFPSLPAMIAELDACLAEEDATGDDTAAIPVARSAARRSPRRQVPVRLLAGLGVLLLAAVVVALLATRDGSGDGAARGGESGAVRLTAVRDHDPHGPGDGEHPEDVPNATDGDPETYWTTETYASFDKPGVGIVLDAGEPVELGSLLLLSDEPGFTAKIQASRRAGRGFRDVSEEQTAAERTTFELDTGGEEYRYYLVWITGLDGRAHVNEVRAG